MSDFTMYVSTKQMQVLQKGCDLLRSLYAQFSDNPPDEDEAVVLPDDDQYRLIAEDFLKVMKEVQRYRVYQEHETYEQPQPKSDQPLPVIVKKGVRVGGV